MSTPVVTAVRDRGARGVEVHLDGARWRVVPVECAVEARLAIGAQLDRERARDLNRALRRRRALGVAVRALHHADHSQASLEARLVQRGVARPEREAALARLQAAGLVDDRRLAVARADLLARRGHSDAGIRHDLERRGVAEAAIVPAIGALAPESDRARAIVAERGASVRTARLLAARGFPLDTIEPLVAGGEGEGLG